MAIEKYTPGEPIIEKYIQGERVSDRTHAQGYARCAECRRPTSLSDIYRVRRLHLCWPCWALIVEDFAIAHPDLVVLTREWHHATTYGREKAL